MQITDTLVEAARQDPQLADQLYREVEDVRRKLRRRLSGFLWLYGDCIEEALDSAFLKALRSYDVRLGGFRAWYYRIGLTESLYACRRERAVLQRLLLVQNIDCDGKLDESADDSIDQRELLECTQQLVAQASSRARSEHSDLETMLTIKRLLTASEWRMVELLMSGYSYREVQRQLGITRYQMDKQMQCLREKLSPVFATY